MFNIKKKENEKDLETKLPSFDDVMKEEVDIIFDANAEEDGKRNVKKIDCLCTPSVSAINNTKKFFATASTDPKITANLTSDQLSYLDFFGKDSFTKSAWLYISSLIKNNFIIAINSIELLKAIGYDTSEMSKIIVKKIEHPLFNRFFDIIRFINPSTVIHAGKRLYDQNTNINNFMTTLNTSITIFINEIYTSLCELIEEDVTNTVVLSNTFDNDIDEYLSGFNSFSDLINYGSFIMKKSALALLIKSAIMLTINDLVFNFYDIHIRNFILGIPESGYGIFGALYDSIKLERNDNDLYEL